MSARLRCAMPPRHWRYFDRFVTAETHWLVPDNFQETPEPVIASRTSPTNIGLQLLATASACDLGFLTRGEMIDRLERAFDSIDRMPRVRGHFFNWYDLENLRVLDPPYVSTVDSGNLAGHLVALAQGCIDIAGAPVDDGRVWAAIEAEGIPHASGDSAYDAHGASTSAASDGGAAWVGERLLAYQAAILDLRRRGPGSATDSRRRRDDALGAATIGGGGRRAVALPAGRGRGRVGVPSDRGAHVILCGSDGRPTRRPCESRARDGRWPWTFDSCTSRSVGSLRSVTTRGPERSMTRCMTCLRPSRGWPVSSPSRRTMPPRNTGSDSAARSPSRMARRRSCRGAARCSSISCRCSSCRRVRSRCSIRPVIRRCTVRSRTRALAAYRGESPSRRTTFATDTRRISIARSACRTSRSNAVWRRISSSRRTRRRWRWPSTRTRR